MRIKDVETQVGITRKNIRYYESEGLLAPAREGENRYRDYSSADLARLRCIKLLRKLDMPISDIRQVLAGEKSLTRAAQDQALALEGRVRDLELSREFCLTLAAERADLHSLDVDGYLERLENMEKEGVQFVNIREQDKKGRYIGPLVACIVILAICVGCVLLFLHLNRVDPAPSIWLVVIPVALFGFLGLGTLIALISRIQEIRKGEENDLSKY